ncbi:MAG: hypothetical protein NTU44_03390 [Bacteroidetes bacterium]|nr:hypothetical protein [Bacteroidota bacterium]
MTRKFFLFILSLIVSFLVNAQVSIDQKRDNIWMFGYDNFPPYAGGTVLNFNCSPLSTTYTSQELNLDLTDASICGTNGQLLFYTNGMYVANSNYQIMPNGDSLNPGDLFNYFDGMGYRLAQGALILPKSNSESLYYILHEKLVWSDDYFALCSGLYYTIVDMSLNNGLGDVIIRNVPILEDSLDPGCITATRHANGRDWWILIPEFLHNKYFLYLLNPQGLNLISTQNIGTASYMMELGQACFSPDGSKYVRYSATDINLPYRLEVFNFDRCTGLLSNYKNLWYVDNAWSTGIAISPNSRYMYVSAELRIDQYDLQAEDIAASKQTVAVYDGFIDPMFPLGSTHFYLEQVGPDGKIYICATNGVRYLHVINHPDLPGTACDVQQHAVQLNTFNSMSLPNFPNFRLGALPCSTCDTLGLGGTVVDGNILYDNNLLTPVDSCWVILKTLNGMAIDSVLSNQEGYYRFCGLQPGSYKLITHTSKTWGGVNSVDALHVLRHFVGLENLTGLFLKSGDVNLTLSLNAVDALIIQKRFVGLTNTFNTGDWLFEEPELSITNTNTQHVNIRCLCYGDVNGSFVPY